jgi:hypothetical protein
MNLEEARNVLWLSNKRRPLGELMDEGYLNRSRLEWAAKKAFDPEIKEAAQVLLQSTVHSVHSAKGGEKIEAVQAQNLDRSMSIGISLEKARATPFPYGLHKDQPMGELIESREITLKDLGNVVETSWDPKMRKAAVALMLVRLDQIVKEPDPSIGFVKVVKSVISYSENKKYNLALIEGLVFGISLGILLTVEGVIFINSLKPPQTRQSITGVASSPMGLLAIAIVLVICLLIAWLFVFIPEQISKRLDKKIEAHRRGEEGEERTVQMIVQALDGNWKLFRNINLPGRSKGDLDIVLVGPPGVWVLEVKNLNGEYRNIGDLWESRRGKHWKAATANPSKQASTNAGRLGSFLKADNLNVWVNPAVVWANEENHVFVENPSVAVWLFNRLPDELGNIWQGEKLSEAERSKIAAKLNKLCEGQKNAR